MKQQRRRNAMKVKKSMIVMMAVLCLGCAGCAKEQSGTDVRNEMESKETGNTENEAGTKDVETEEDTAKNLDFPEKMQETINGVTFDMDILIPEDADMGNLHKTTATLQQPDIPKAKDVFAKEKNVVEERNEMGAGEDGIEFPCYTAYYDDETYLKISTNLVYNHTPVFEKVNGAFRLYSYCNTERYSKDKVLELGDPQKIFETILSNIHEVGYQLEDTSYDYYALDHETMEKEFMMLDKSGEALSTEEISWGVGDDCYFFTAVQRQEGLPVYFGSQDFPEDEEGNRPIQALYSSNGIERLEISQLYSFSEPGETVSLLDFDTIVETVSKKYGDVIGASYTVKRAELYKMPVKLEGGDYDVKIVWLFEVQESGVDSDTGKEYEYTQYMFVDAESGAEVFH